VAEIALAEIEAEVIPHHDEEALVGGLIEAELLLQLLDERGIEPARAAIFGVDGVGAGTALHLPARTEIPARTADAGGGAGLRAAELGDDVLDRSARRELHDNEGRQHDAEQGRDHEQDAPDDVGGHGLLCSYPARSIRAARSRSYHHVSGIARSPRS